MITMTRRELYDLVWSKPRLTLSEQFNISDVGLGKICKRYEVPVPERGYWARLRAGRTVSQPEFAELTSPDRLVKIPEPGDTLEGRIRELAKVERAARLQSQPNEEAVAQRKRELLIVVEPTIQKLKDDRLQGLQPCEAFGPGLCGIQIPTWCVSRMIELLLLLAGRAATREIWFKSDEDHLLAGVGLDGVRVELGNVNLRETRCLTDESRDQLQQEFDASSKAAGIKVPRLPHEVSVVVEDRLDLLLEIIPDDGNSNISLTESHFRSREKLVDIFLDCVELETIRVRLAREEFELREANWERERQTEERAKAAIRREADIAALVLQVEQSHRRWLETKALVAELEARCHGRPEPELQQLLRWTREQLARHEAAIEADNLVRLVAERGLLVAGL